MRLTAVLWLAVALIVLAGIYYVIQLRALKRRGPRDSVGNGIAIGKAKAFDNRSLQLRIEHLSTGLAALNVVNQKLTDNLPLYQGEFASSVSGSLTLGAGSAAGQTQSKSANADSGPNAASAARGGTADASSKPSIGLAASDVLADQLNLASQIMNLEMLYERSLTDRLLDDGARLQTVLGFQISINPPAGYENCVAIVEIGVRDVKSNAPVSLVALIPQEKTYNAQSISSSAQSIGGSAIASVLTLGFSAKGESRQLFVHRDSDTVAFERNQASGASLFGDAMEATVFGWEFRPVLGQLTVSSGTRQLLAVISLPEREGDVPENVSIKLATRSYWRRLDRASQTTKPRWRPWPLTVDGSNRVDFPRQELPVPNTAKIQESLAPKVTGIKWVNSGIDRATVIVKGSNFFAGTRVLIGGAVLREQDGTLTLKSDQVLELNTTIAVLSTGDAVLSGRFGASFRLEVPKDKRPAAGLYISRAAIRPSRYAKAFRITVDVRAVADDGVDQDITVAAIQGLPDAILFVGSEPIAMPYDYTDIDPALPPRLPATGNPTAINLNLLTTKYFTVEAWIPAKVLARNPSVTFRIPFCGSDYDASQPLSFSEPTITRMGADTQFSVLRIAYPFGFGSYISVELDRTYVGGGPELTKSSDVEYRFQVPTAILSTYSNVVVRLDTAEPYLLPIPADDHLKPKPTFDASAKPPQVTVGSLGPVFWSGTALDGISEATLFAAADAPGTSAPESVAAPTGMRADFSAFDEGKQIEVYFREGSTAKVGKAEVEFRTAAGHTIRMPIFIAK